MQLADLNSNLPKPWLNIKSNSMVTESLQSNSIDSNIITLENQTSVPNAPINAINFFSNSSGVLSGTNNSGDTVTYSTAPTSGTYVVGTAPSVVNNIPMFNDTDATTIIDSTIASTNLLLADGSVPMTSNLNIAGNSVNNVSNIFSNGLALNNLGSSSNYFDVAYLQDGSVAAAWKFTQGALAGISNTTTESPITTNDISHNNGNLNFTQPFSNGQQFSLFVGFNMSSLSTDTFTINVKMDGTTILAIPLNYNLSSTTRATLTIDMSIAPSSTWQIRSYGTALINGVLPNVTYSTNNFNPAINHTFSLTGQWSAASPSDNFQVTNIRCLSYNAQHS